MLNHQSCSQKIQESWMQINADKRTQKLHHQHASASNFLLRDKFITKLFIERNK